MTTPRKRIGSRQGAARALQVNRAHQSGQMTRAMERVWEHVGSGSARTTWLHKPSGVAYKVGRYGEHSPWQSEHEVKNAYRIRAHPYRGVSSDGRRVKVTAPRMTAYMVPGEPWSLSLVLAADYIPRHEKQNDMLWHRLRGQEYRDGEAPGLSKWLRETPGGNDPQANNNVRLKGRTWYIIDAGL